jgi:hypothetical protein
MDYFVKLVTEIGEENLMKHCCKFLLLSTFRPTTEERTELIAKLEQDQHYEDMRTLATRSKELQGCVEPEQDQRYQHQEIREDSKPAEPVELEDMDHWVQCGVYACERWHKVPHSKYLEIEAGGFHFKWVCADNTWDRDLPQCAADIPHAFKSGPAPKTPKAAEAYWPSARAKRVVKHFYPTLHPCHMEALIILARRRSLTLEQLCRMKPRDYIDNHSLSQKLFGNEYYYRW